MIADRFEPRIGPGCLGLIAAGLAALALPAVAQTPRTLEIPVEEFEAFEGADHKPIPTPPGNNPLEQFLNIHDLDLTDTLPEAVMEQMLGATPMAFRDVVWGFETRGNWTQAVTGTGTLQVFDFTEGLGTTGTANPERFTGERGFHSYVARMHVNGEPTYSLAAAFPPEGAGEFGSELEGSKGGFYALSLCHILEPGRTGCVDGSDDYLYTEIPATREVRVRQVRGSYSMHFSARVEEYRYNTATRAPGAPLKTPTGRIADVRGWVCETEAWEADPENCLPAVELHVVEVTPSDRRENVNFSTPTVEFEFNEPVHQGSVESGFTLTTRDRRDNEIKVPGTIVRASAERYAFVPDEDLESGVQYEARLDGGADGIQAREGEGQLGADHWWRFSTLLDIENHTESKEDPLEMHVFQTVRNPPLITEKPTVIRIYAHWEEHEHIHPDWQPTSFPITLDLNVVSDAQRRVEQQFGRETSTKEIRLHRPDQFNDANRRQAEHTINVYGWSPGAGDGGLGSVQALLAPHEPFPGPPDPAEVMVERDFQISAVDPDPLVLYFAFLTIGPWADGVRSEDWLMAEDMARIAAEYATQILPFREVRTVITHVEMPKPWNEAAGPGKNIAPMTSLLRDLRASPNLGAERQDVFVVLYPTGVLTFGGASIKTRFSSAPDRGLILNTTYALPDGRRVPVSHQAQSLVHEIGHHHLLEHRPGDAPSEDAGHSCCTNPYGYSEPGFEGFRLAPDGMSGWNKSFTEGNAQAADPPAPLMWPSPLDFDRVWITDEEYRTVLEYLGRQ